jgi:CRISPR-associated protein Csd1
VILQRLVEYYDRVETLPRFGWVRRRIDYVFVLENGGQCITVESLERGVEKSTSAPEMLVPAIGKQAMKHTMSGKDANLLWDNSKFVLGLGKGGASKLACFRDTLRAWLGDVRDPGVSAVEAFCGEIAERNGAVGELLDSFGLVDDFEKRDPCIVFRLVRDVEPVFARRAVRDAYDARLAESSASDNLIGNCLVTGDAAIPITKNETVIKGVWGSQTSGANVVSFNARAFESYGKRQRGGENAPIGQRASFAYTTALNHLLRKGSDQRVQVGDSSTVFWAQKQDNELETVLPSLFSDPPPDDPEKGTRAVHELYRAVETGKFAVGEADDPVHVLGLSPSAARISIRFWETAPALELARRVRQHFEDLRIGRGPNDPEHLSLSRLLRACAQLEKADNVPPSLGGEVIRAILSDLPYPATLLHAAVQRCRAEQRVTYTRAAAIKAWLCREQRRAGQSSSRYDKEPQPMLDTSNPSPAYRLGRLFATLEKIQEESSPGINATIRDRFYGAASGTPGTVFPTLLRLKNHHMGKLGKGRAIQMERLVAEIMDGLTDFPSHMLMPDQGRFAVGYYHQRHALFTKRTNDTEDTGNGTDAKETDR